MDKLWELITDVFIGLMIIFISILIYFSIRTETVLKSSANHITDNFINDIKNNGYLTINDYECYIKELSITDVMYDIALEHKCTIAEPEYRFRTIEEIIDAQNGAYTGDNTYHYRDVVTQVPPVSDPVNDSSLNTETNESVLASAVNTPASLSHVHNEDCYHGIKHVHTGSPTSGGGCYSAIAGGSMCGGGFSPTGDPATSLTQYIPCSCGGTIRFTWASQGFRCSNGHSFSMTTYETLVCDSCSFSSTETFSPPSICTASQSSYGLNCGKIEGHYYNGDAEVFSICNQIVTNIIGTHLIQTVAINDPLITTVRASYLDGSTKVVIATTTFQTNNIKQNEIAEFIYSYILNGTTYSKSCNVTVTVIPRTRTCVNGHVYNLRADGSDPGCPYCMAWVGNLRVINPPTSTMTITIGTTLKDNGVKLLVTYMDGRTETIDSGYVDNLDTGYLGTKLVTIGYKGVTTQLMVTTICAKMTCDICGFEYDLYPDFTNPGCPHCISKIPIFTGNILYYEDAIYTEDILEKLFRDGVYRFGINDTVSVSIENKSTTMGRSILKKIIPSLSDKWILIRKIESVKG